MGIFCRDVRQRVSIIITFLLEMKAGFCRDVRPHVSIIITFLLEMRAGFCRDVRLHVSMIMAGRLGMGVGTVITDKQRRAAARLYKMGCADVFEKDEIRSHYKC